MTADNSAGEFSWRQSSIPVEFDLSVRQTQEMSRYRRHVQIMGHTKTKSEKDDKQRAAMTARKRLHNQLNPQTASAEGFDLQTGEDHPRSGQWTFAKDGKGYYKRATKKDMRK